MNVSTRWSLSDSERKLLISRLSENLPMLRAKLNISQEELAGIIGISRQTYCSIESFKRDMSWQVYLSLILFFELNSGTHSILHHIDVFPDALADKEIVESEIVEKDNCININMEIAQMLLCLDDQALQSVKTMIMVEYARCSNIPGEAVVKAFGGMDYKKKLPDRDNDLRQAIKNWRMYQDNDE